MSRGSEEAGSCEAAQVKPTRVGKITTEKAVRPRTLPFSPHPTPVVFVSHRGVMLPPSGQSADDSWRPIYVTGDLFSCPEDEALAHCISEDCRMGAGIAVRFRKEFDGVEELQEQSESHTPFKLNMERQLVFQFREAFFLYT